MALFISILVIISGILTFIFSYIYNCGEYNCIIPTLSWLLWFIINSLLDSYLFFSKKTKLSYIMIGIYLLGLTLLGFWLGGEQREYQNAGILGTIVITLWPIFFISRFRSTKKISNN